MEIIRQFKNLAHRAEAQFFSYLYGNPSRDLKVIGITGTDGKTTTATLLYEILQEAGFQVGLITTISAKIGDRSIATGFHVTTPTPNLLQKLLKEMVDAGMEYVIIEITSHGLDQYRVGGIEYNAGIFTNISHEHLDYHKTYEAYLATKARLIELIVARGFVALNQDDMSFEGLSTKAKETGTRMLTYGFTENSDMYATDYSDTTKTTRFTVNYKGEKHEIEMHLPGEYNVYNSLGAIQVAIEMGVDLDTVNRGLKKVTTLEGRWEIIQSEPYKVIVDFAHTPNALVKMLEYAAVDNKKGRKILVFGSAGKRDIDKRPMMGEAAGNGADFVILTAEDPRGESVQNISRQIAVGLQQAGKEEEKDYTIVEDRRAAIKKALKMAKPGDSVIISGKGHEKSLNLDGENEIDWSDQLVVKELLHI